MGRKRKRNQLNKPKMATIVTFEELGNYMLPEKTDTYVPVGHQQLVNTVKRIGSDHFNHEPLNGQIEVNKTGAQMFGTLSWQGDDGSNISVGFRNSYDKSMAVGLCAGAQIVVCSNMMFAGDVLSMRKHTGNITADLDDLVEDLVKQADGIYAKTVDDSHLMQEMRLTDSMVGDFFGQLFVNEGILNGSQLKKATSEWFKSPTFKDRTVWSAYNAVTEALKSSHTSHALDKYTCLHKYTEDYFLKDFRNHVDKETLELIETENYLSL